MKRRIPEDTISKIIGLAKEGLVVSEISKEAFVCKQTVRSILDEHNVPIAKKKKKGRGFCKKVYAFYKRDKFIAMGTLNEIAKSAGYTRGSMYVIKGRAARQDKNSKNGYTFVEL